MACGLLLGPLVLSDWVALGNLPELFALRFQHATHQLENPIRIADVRKDIARALTVQRQKQLKADR